MVRTKAPPFARIGSRSSGGVWTVGSRCGVKYSHHKHHTRPSRVYKRAGRMVSDSRHDCVEKRRTAILMKRMKGAMARGHVSGRRRKL
jgi:hypothetical protein